MVPPPSTAPRAAKRVRVEPLPAPAAPMSALAARKAAAAAQPSSSSDPSFSSEDSTSSDSEQEAAELVLSAPSSSRDTSPRLPPTTKRRGKRATTSKPGRYFAGLDSGEGESTISRARSKEPLEPLGEHEALEVEEEGEGEVLPKASTGKLGRGKRQRRERSAFVDPFCVSSFVPEGTTNTRELSWLVDGVPKEGLLCCLDAGETLIVHGSYTLSPIFGSMALSSAIISAPPVDTTTLLVLSPPSKPYEVFAPSSHPLPIIESLQLPFSAQRTTSLLLPDGESIDISTYSTVVLLSELGSGIEGVERVLRCAGMGCGNGMWSVEDPTRGNKKWGGQGWRLITEPTPSLTCARSPGTWMDALAAFDPPPVIGEGDEEEMVLDAERLVAIVQGPKRVGKSTFARSLLNRLLSRYEQVAYLDTDLGQPEFTPPGLVSLTVLNTPIFGPSFTHPSIPIGSHYLGATSPANDPETYLAAVLSLLETYNHQIEYPLLDDIRPRSRLPTATPRERVQRRVRDRVPLVINTQGWIKGLGADLLLKIKQAAEPTHSYFLELETEESNYPQDENGGQGERGMSRRLESAPSSPLDSKWSAADLRTLAFISYFHSVFPFTPLHQIVSVSTNLFPIKWDFTRALKFRTPWNVDWSDHEMVRSVILSSGEEVEKDQILYALNTSLVALLHDFTPPPPISPSSLNSSQAFPYEPTGATPNPFTSRCISLALIRSISPLDKSLHLIFPFSPQLLESQAVTIVKGSLEIPLGLILNFNLTKLSKGGERSGEGEGEREEESPYLCAEIGDTGGGRKKVRRNLMRRGQN